ncbi:CDP-diacylglycerol--serine O-phosphatidyltransferase [Paenibacillus donghaensis]|uniref:CDP-diacylglycerol--serine O-phosphatidyltransferase n=1 Tax=Paenibacillus donghaensis TaxID=414771 RepID=UPI001883E105|nr:CDP-diacylglycerol--serine O-phosphatidyltransferase [Paenibacillus donghaensis]MBE9918312.1 CDP-diacylglycerol--serine O-phosphatidyltransferase [Paenibacillus donghaensis]
MIGKEFGVNAWIGVDTMLKMIPNFCTLLNLCCGMLAIVSTFSYTKSAAVLLILFGMILDWLDGFAARKLHVTSVFGKTLDSLCDLVTFGIAPAFLCYAVTLHHMFVFGIMLTGLFPICGAIQLARYNVQSGQTRGFIGMPITFAGGLLSVVVLITSSLHASVTAVVVLVLSWFMVSVIHFPSFNIQRYRIDEKRKAEL